jgi:hypothetical protein
MLWRCAILVTTLWVSIAWISPVQRYPDVQPFTRTVPVPDVPAANVVIDLKSVRGVPVYQLQCHAAAYKGDPGFDYSGDFECRLTLLGAPGKYSNLLTEDAHQSRDWESRGRFFSESLRGECGQIPNFGIIREFRLRRMRLTLRLGHLAFNIDGKVKALTLTVTVAPDSQAVRPIAEVVPIPHTSRASECKLRHYFVDSVALERGR